MEEEDPVCAVVHPITINASNGSNVTVEITMNITNNHFPSPSKREAIVKSFNGVIIDCNDHFADLLMYSREHLIGRKVSEFILSSSREQILANIVLGVPSNTQHGMIRSDGTVINVEASGATDSHGYRHTIIRAMQCLTMHCDEGTLQWFALFMGRWG